MITDFHFGGPYFCVFISIGHFRIRCVKTGDIFDKRGLYEAYTERRNLAPVIYGEGPVDPWPACLAGLTVE